MNPISANPATTMMRAFERETEQRTTRTRPARRTYGFRARRRRAADLG